MPSNTTPEQEDASWEAWSDAWDQARDEDAKASRRYDKRIYADRAHDARIAYLDSLKKG